MKFTVLISKGAEFLIGRVKEIPAVMTQGTSEEEVMENISDALNLYIEGSTENMLGADVPVDEPGYGQLISSRELEVA